MVGWFWQVLATSPQPHSLSQRFFFLTFLGPTSILTEQQLHSSNGIAPVSSCWAAAELTLFVYQLSMGCCHGVVAAELSPGSVVMTSLIFKPRRQGLQRTLEIMGNHRPWTDKTCFGTLALQDLYQEGKAYGVHWTKISRCISSCSHVSCCFFQASQAICDPNVLNSGLMAAAFVMIFHIFLS